MPGAAWPLVRQAPLPTFLIARVLRIFAMPVPRGEEAAAERGDGAVLQYSMRFQSHWDRWASGEVDTSLVGARSPKLPP